MYNRYDIIYAKMYTSSKLDFDYYWLGTVKVRYINYYSV